MNAYPGEAIRLADRYERACAYLAWIALCDIITGNSRALVRAKRLERMHSNIPAQEIVADVYSQKRGRTNDVWGAWCCNECGWTFMGKEAADRCCSEWENE